MKHLIVVALCVSLLLPAPAVAGKTAIPGLDQLKISYDVKKAAFKPKDSKGRAPSDNYVLEVELRDLSKAQYDQLSASLGSDSSIRPEFHPGAKYQLRDFLPSALHALDGKQFVPIAEKFTWPDLSGLKPDDVSAETDEIQNFHDSQTKLSTYINCWTTAYELLRNWRQGEKSPDMDITWMSRSAATNALTSKYTTPLKPGEPARFGDLIVFSAYDKGPSMDLVQHAAIAVLPGLYFEKTDSGPDDAFRLVTEEDLLAKYKAAFGAKLKTGRFRLKEGVQLPRLSETNSLYAAKEFYGEYFSEADMRTITFQHDWIASMPGAPSKAVFEPYRLHSIRIVGGALDTKNPIYQNFRTVPGQQKPQAAAPATPEETNTNAL